MHVADFILHKKWTVKQYISNMSALLRATAEIVYLVKSCGDIRTMSPSYCVMRREYQYKNKSSIVIITIKILASCPSKNTIWVENISLKTWQKYSDETFDSFILGFSPQADFQQNMREGYCVDVRSKYFNDSISDPINASVSL